MMWIPLGSTSRGIGRTGRCHQDRLSPPRPRPTNIQEMERDISRSPVRVTVERRARRPDRHTARGEGQTTRTRSVELTDV